MCRWRNFCLIFLQYWMIVSPCLFVCCSDFAPALILGGTFSEVSRLCSCRFFHYPTRKQCQIPSWFVAMVDNFIWSYLYSVGLVVPPFFAKAIILRILSAVILSSSIESLNMSSWVTFVSSLACIFLHSFSICCCVSSNCSLQKEQLWSWLLFLKHSLSLL